MIDPKIQSILAQTNSFEEDGETVTAEAETPLLQQFKIWRTQVLMLQRDAVILNKRLDICVERIKILEAQYDQLH